ncbi:hypothetical protein K492DRAFT_204960 [Lichtheimia hyalospora FSU 10163]|nr:hypothetical protein K492DRAFT_204960 [Lichtheimia hyalospora FSU 10163]
MAASDEALMTSSVLNPPPNDILPTTKVAVANDRRRSTSDVFRLRRSSAILESVPRCSVCRRRFHSLGNLANHHQFFDIRAWEDSDYCHTVFSQHLVLVGRIELVAISH